MRRESGLIFADAHAHTNPLRGLGAKTVAEKFRGSGGWFMALISLPPTSLGLSPSLEGFERSVELVISECKAARKAGLKVACLGGYHPAMIDKMIDKLGMRPEDVYRTSIRIIDHACTYIEKGLLDGIAEVGRPHYQVKPHYVVLAEMVLDYALTKAKDLGAIVHLHLEEGGWITAKDIEERIKRIGLDRNMVAMHHAKPGVLEHAISMGIPATVPAIYQVIRVAVKHSGFYMFESDYIDDPTRPGKVIYPWEISENTHKAVKEGFLDEGTVYRIHVDNIARFYGTEPP